MPFLDKFSSRLQEGVVKEERHSSDDLVRENGGHHLEYVAFEHLWSNVC